MTCRWIAQFLIEVEKQNCVDYCSKSSMGADQIIGMTLSLVLKADFIIKIRRRSVKVKFGLQKIIHSQAKFS